MFKEELGMRSSRLSKDFVTSQMHDKHQHGTFYF